jgi:hypothetical protein
MVIQDNQSDGGCPDFPLLTFQRSLAITSIITSIQLPPTIGWAQPFCKSFSAPVVHRIQKQFDYRCYVIHRAFDYLVPGTDTAVP